MSCLRSTFNNDEASTLHSFAPYYTEMSFHRVGLRLAQQPVRSAFRPALRSTQRRFESGVPSPPGQGSTKLVGAADNAFNRERAAVKAHAAATSGKVLFLEMKLTGDTNRRQISGVNSPFSMKPRTVTPMRRWMKSNHDAVSLSPASSLPLSTPTICGTSIGSIGNTCLPSKNVSNTLTKISGRGTSSGEMVIRLCSGTTRSTITGRTSKHENSHRSDQTAFYGARGLTWSPMDESVSSSR